MRIVIGSLLDGAREAAGAVAIIDVLRAFTTAAVALANGATRIIMVGEVADALALRASGVVQLCIGEVGGLPPPDFEFGNSPFALSALDLSGKTIAQRTSAGTQGIVAAARAERLYAASLVTARATALALRSGTQDRISLVAMGNNAETRADEDELCALHLRHLLEGRAGAPAALREMIMASREAMRFRDPARPHFHPSDLEIALDIDRYDFAIRVTLEEGRPVGRLERQA